jgi:kynureninase
VSASREEAAALDAADPLAGFRDRFLIDDEALVYLDGNSLGRPPRAAVERAEAFLRDGWAKRLIRGWDEGWMELPTRLGDRLGTALLGAAPGQVVLADSTTVCLYKLASAALDARPDRTELVTDTGNFPTDRYVLEALADQRGLAIHWLDDDPHPDDVAAAIGPQTALVALSHVAYRSGRLLDMPGITRAAHRAGALTLWDLCHSVGAVPVELDESGADLAVGCTYKFLNGGPGAPAFLYVRAAHQHALRQPIWGWLGSRDPFAMGPRYVPADGISQALSGTPPVLALTAASAGIELSAEAGIDRIRAKGIALTELVIALADDRLADHGVLVETPRDPRERGAHVALSHPRARKLCAALVERGVVGDFRGPDVLRFGVSPLTTRFTDVWDAVATFADLLAEAVE